MLASQAYGAYAGIVTYGYGPLEGTPECPYFGETTIAGFVPETGAYGQYASTCVTVPGSPPGRESGRYGVPILGEGIVFSRNLYKEVLLQDRMGVGDVITTTKSTAGSLSLDGRYEGLERLLAVGMGFENVVLNKSLASSPQHYLGGSPFQLYPGSGVYEHLFELDNTISTIGWQLEDFTGSGATLQDLKDIGLKAGDSKKRRGTLFVDMGYGIVAHTGCYVNSFSIEGQVNNAVKFTFDLTARRTRLLTLKNRLWAPPLNNQRIIFSDLTCFIAKLNPAVLDAPADPFAVTPVSNFTVKVNNSLATNNRSYRGDPEPDSHELGQLIDEPFRQSNREVTGTLSFPRLTGQAQDILKTVLYEDFSASNLFAIRLQFIGTVIPNVGNPEAETFLFQVDFPKVRLGAKYNKTGPGITPAEFDFTALRPRSDNAWENSFKYPYEGSPGQRPGYNMDLIKNNEMVVVLRNSVPGNLLRRNGT